MRLPLARRWSRPATILSQSREIEGNPTTSDSRSRIDALGVSPGEPAIHADRMGATIRSHTVDHTPMHRTESCGWRDSGSYISNASLISAQMSLRGERHSDADHMNLLAFKEFDQRLRDTIVGDNRVDLRRFTDSIGADHP